MSAFDLDSLPQPLPAYFAAEDHRSTHALFAPDATVRDERETHSGSEAIKAWLDSVEERYHPRYRVEAAEADGERTIVSFEVAGTFPGSPVMLRQAITVRGGKIAALETL
jgi:hypothetical protein